MFHCSCCCGCQGPSVYCSRRCDLRSMGLVSSCFMSVWNVCHACVGGHGKLEGKFRSDCQCCGLNLPVHAKLSM
jgi:hypothetical protein